MSTALDFTEGLPPKLITDTVSWGICGSGVPFLYNEDTGRVLMYRSGYSIVCISGEICPTEGVTGTLAGILDLQINSTLPALQAAIYWLEGGELPKAEKLN